MYIPTYGMMRWLTYLIEQYAKFNPHTNTGCDRSTWVTSTRRTGFNPRTRIGCDHYPLLNNIARLVSIHAPVRVRLPQGWHTRLHCRSFNPRTRIGCDTISGLSNHSHCVFQSTHPYRVRRSFGYIIWQSRRFQSTHPYRVRL